MRILIFIISTVFVLWSSHKASGQEYEDKSFYLVDSLILEELTEADKLLLDSSLAIYHNAKDDTSRIKALGPICIGVVHTVNSKYRHLQLGLTKEALAKKPQGKVLTALEKSLAFALKNVGLLHQEQGDIALSLEQYFESLKIYERLDDSVGIASCYNSIGNVYQLQNDFPKAIDYTRRGLEIYERRGDENGASMCLNNLGIFYWLNEEYDEGIKCLERNLELKRRIGSKRSIAIGLNNIAFMYKEQDNPDAAMKNYLESMKLYEEVGDNEGVVIVNISIGELYLKQNKLNEALKHINRSLELAKEMGVPELIRDAARFMSQVYEKQRHGFKALEMHKLYMLMKDSIINDETQKATIEQQTKYEYEKQKVLDDAERDKQIAIEQEEKEKQQILTYATGLVLCMVIGFLIFVFNRLRITRMQKGIIEDQKGQIVESINYSEKIQKALLPDVEDIAGSFGDFFIYFRPKDIVSGDFYWYNDFDDHLLLACVDCTGHGVPGGFMSTLGSMLLNKVGNDSKLTPGEVLKSLSDEIIKVLQQEKGGEIQDGMDISLCLINKSDNTVEYSGARNGIIVIGEESKRYKASMLPVGGNYMKKGKPILREFKSHSIDLSENDWVFMYTDGFMEQLGEKENLPMNYEQFETILNSTKTVSSNDERIVYLDEQFKDWKGNNEQYDDILIIGFKPISQRIQTANRA